MNTEKAVSRISLLEQIGIYFGKCQRIFVNEKGWKNLISAAIITVILCSVTGEDMFKVSSATRTGSFAVTCACIWVGIFNSIRSICSERSIIKREHRSGMSIFAYVSAHALFDGLVCIGEGAIMTVLIIVFNIQNIPFMGVLLPSFLELFIDYTILLFAADLLGILVSCLVPNENAAMTVMPFVLIIEMVMAGTIFELEGFAKTLSNFMISRWGLAAMCVTANINGMSFLYQDNDFAYSIENLLCLWGLLLLFCVVSYLLSIVSLSLVDRDKR